MPKVLVEIGGKPILWHLMRSYASQGFSRFIVATGYLGEQIPDRVASAGAPPEGWTTEFADTGLDTNTGGRIQRVRDRIEGHTFLATYGDGLSDVDLRHLLAFHHAHNRIATVTVVRPRLPFGMVEIDGDTVRRFDEKPRLDAWVNGGFFVFDSRVFDYLRADSVLENEPLRQLAADGELMAFRHEGFWACMDTYKDSVQLNMFWDSGEAPWCTWK